MIPEARAGADLSHALRNANTAALRIERMTNASAFASFLVQDGRMSAHGFAPRAAHAMGFAGALLLLTIGSCRESPVAPDAGISSEAPALDPRIGGLRLPGADVPQFRRFEVDQVGHDLHIRFSVDHRANPIHYDPVRPDGWSFQLFLDTDQSPKTGYWRGYDYLTRDSELDLDGRSIRVRRTIPLDGPGTDGWGEETALVPIHVNESTLTFRVPLAAVTDHDGRVDFALEVYRTSACAECPNGRTFDFAYGMFGTSDPHGRSLHVRHAEPGECVGHYARMPETIAAR